MPVATATATEYAALTDGCAIVEPAADGKLAVTGRDAGEFLAGQVSNDVAGLSAGHGVYAALLTNKGKMLADLRVVHTGDELLLLTERATLQVLFDTLRRTIIGWDAELHKRTLELERIVLAGPATPRVAGDQLPVAEHDCDRVEIAGHEVLRVRTDVGADLLCPAAAGDAVRHELQARGAVPVSDAAAAVLRIEHGRPRYGVDLDDTVIPQEAGLNDRAVSFTKGCYVGQETVARLFYKGKPNRHLRGVRLAAEAEPGTVVRAGDREVGVLGSVAVSPAAGPVALALLRREVEPGDGVQVGDQATPATVVELPFTPA